MSEELAKDIDNTNASAIWDGRLRNVSKTINSGCWRLYSDIFITYTGKGRDLSAQFFCLFLGQCWDGKTGGCC